MLKECTNVILYKKINTKHGRNLLKSNCGLGNSSKLPGVSPPEVGRPVLQLGQWDHFFFRAHCTSLNFTLSCLQFSSVYLPYFKLTVRMRKCSEALLHESHIFYSHTDCNTVVYWIEYVFVG